MQKCFSTLFINIWPFCFLFHWQSVINEVTYDLFGLHFSYCLGNGSFESELQLLRVKYV